jgi:DtxR family Mn-dependent transcriptional regulator
MIPRQKVEEILEAIWKADEGGEFTLAAARRYCPEEISDAHLRDLESEELIIREGERILFSAEGREQARAVIRRHRLTESLLTYVLGMPEEKADAIACEMEHQLPPEMERSICTLLGHPPFSPTGKPIPPGDDCREKLNSVDAAIMNLCDLSPGDEGRIVYIRPKNHSRLHRLTAFGLVPGVTVRLHQTYPAFCLKFEETELAIDPDVAEDIFVSRIGQPALTQPPRGAGNGRRSSRESPAAGGPDTAPDPHGSRPDRNSISRSPGRRFRIRRRRR